MKGSASATGLPIGSNFASRRHLCSGLVATLLAILLLELGSIHRPGFGTSSKRSKQSYVPPGSAENLPQGPDQQLWNMQAQKVLSMGCFALLALSCSPERLFELIMVDQLGLRGILLCAIASAAMLLAAGNAAAAAVAAAATVLRTPAGCP